MKQIKSLNMERKYCITLAGNTNIQQLNGNQPFSDIIIQCFPVEVRGGKQIYPWNKLLIPVVFPRAQKGISALWLQAALIQPC